MNLLTHFDEQRFGGFVMKWMENTGRTYRKTLSYSGAVRSRIPTDPVHYVDPITQEKYFDPTNWVYGLILRLLAPGLEKEDWNDETRGDIMEALMGLHHVLRQSDPRSVDGYFLHCAEFMAWLVDSVSWLGYRLYQEQGCNFPKHIAWIRSLTDWRKSAESVSLAIENIGAPPDPTGPRDKSGGTLSPLLEV